MSTLFDSDPQFREKETLRRFFSLLPLWGSLAGGHVFRWFAVNIPMSLAGDPAFTSDLDVVACLRGVPPMQDQLIHRTWEVKVGLLGRDGSARSTKAGKTRRTLNQLNAYRRFGSPSVSLLDMLLCEDEALEGWPGSAEDAILTKGEACRANGFGYDIAAFEANDLSDPRINFRARTWSQNPMHTVVTLVRPINFPMTEPFSSLVARIEAFCEAGGHRGPPRIGQQVHYCRECRQLQLVHARLHGVCPDCGSKLAVQT